MENIGIYVHIPFCMRKCYYCDFCSYPGQLEKQEDYVQALKEEIKENVITVFPDDLSLIHI